MAYTAIADTDIDANSPVTEALMTALRDNPYEDDAPLSGLAGAGLQKIETQTAAASSSLDMEAGTWSNYEAVLFVLKNLIPATAGDFQVRTSTDGGVTYDSSSSDYAYVFADLDSAGGDTVVGSTGATLIALHANNAATTANAGVHGTILLLNPSDTKYTSIVWNIGGMRDPANTQFASRGQGVRLSAADVDGLRILHSAGNISTGEVTSYGVKS